MTITTTPLTQTFGVRVDGLSLHEAAHGDAYPELRALFEQHSALLFRGQDFDGETHLALARRFGPVEDRLADERKPGEAYEIPKVSNVRDDGGVTPEMDLHTLNLKANMLWHVDSSFLPVPALTNILVARVVTSTGGATELATTRAAWAEMPADLKARIAGRGVWHHLSHSRRRISPELAALPMFHKWPEQHWGAVWTNPATGTESLYVASHAYRVDGCSEAEGQEILDALIAFCTQPRFTYAHQWQAGDVLIWDQRAVMHRATPWPYDEPRTLTSLCVSARPEDGLDSIRL